MMSTTGLSRRIRIAFVVHIMHVAGAETLIASIIRRLKDSIEPVVLCLDGLGTLGESLRRENLPVIALGRQPGLDLSTSGRLAHEIRAHRCDVVHAHQYTPFFYAALAKLRVRPHFHLIFTEHGRHFPDVVSRKRYWANRIFLSRLANEVTAVCRFSANSLRETEGFRRAPVEVIPNGIDLHDYHPADSRLDQKARLGLNSKARHIVCVARFHPVKDHATLLRAFSEIRRSRADVELILVGDGPLRHDLEQQAISLGVADCVHFLGLRSDIPSILQAAELFVLPSRSEAASLTLLEAMASALPVVVTDVGGNGEIVKNGVEGLLVPRRDAAAMAKACLDVLADPDLGTKMGMKGRARVERSFRLEDTIDAYYQRYVAAARGHGL